MRRCDHTTGQHGRAGDEDGAAQRARRRSTSSAEERAAFYAAITPQVSPALTYLDGKPLAQFDDRDRRLMKLLLSLSHVALAVELQGDDEARHAQGRQHIRITRASADFGP